MPRFRLLIEYAGTRYSGWQIQKNARTIQGEIDRAVRQLSGRKAFELYGSGRTDAGVHALAQVAHLELYTTLTPELLRRQINDELPADIHIREVATAPHRFHARHDAIARSYLYQISRRRTAFAKPFVWWVREPLNLQRMREAAAAFRGLKDFASFTDDDPADKSTHVLIENLPDWMGAPNPISAVGRGELQPADAAGFLDDRSGAATAAALTAPAAGLFLEAVYYKGDAGPGPLRPAMPVD